MGIGTTIGVIGGGLASAGIGAGASLSAAGTQASAAENAQQLQAQEAQNALNFQEQQYNTEQSQLAPYYQAGTAALSQLANGQLPAFQAPTAAQAAATPGEQFELQQGSQAVQNSAAARGGLLSGNTLAAEQQYGQGLAATNYQQAYNNAMQTYNTNVIGPYQRLAQIAGIGQQAQATGAQQGQAASNNISNISLTSGAQQGQQLNNAGAATASGYVGLGNALGGGLNNISQYLLLSQLMNGSANTGPYGYGSGQLNPETTPLGTYT
jgi:hypothetical protein